MIGRVVVDQVRAREIDGLVLAGTHANGVYSFDAPGTVEPPISEEVVAVGATHTCAKLQDRSLKCWGASSTGQLGLGDVKSRGDESGEMGGALPAVDVGTDDSGTPFTVEQLAVGSAHTCVLLGTGEVKCWGGNSNAQLGLGDEELRGDEPGEMGDNLPTVDLGTGRTATRTATGHVHTCALLDNSRIKCWGGNSHGQLGLGDTEDRGDGLSGQTETNEMGDNLPAVDLGTNEDGEPLAATQVAPGQDHTCALLATGEVKCWGGNGQGQLGLGDTDPRGDEPGEMGDNLPTVDLGTGRTATQIVAGGGSTCALLDNDHVKCWGDNDSGALGLGDTKNRGDESGEMGDNLSAVNLGTGRTATQISLSCALLDNGKVKCWGANPFGALGLGDEENRGDEPGEMGDNLPAVNLGTGRTARWISARDHGCALLDNDTVKCWGANHNGELGLGDTQNRGDGFRTFRTQPAREMGDNLPTVNLGDRPLPVELVRFEARLKKEVAVLHWRTAGEKNNAGFEVQRRRADAEVWSQVGFVEGTGTTSEPQTYRHRDESLPYEADTLVYRLRQVDTDGTASFSEETTIRRSPSGVQLQAPFPNPTSRQATLRFAVPKRQDVTIRLYDVLGRRVKTVLNGKKEGRQQLQVDVSGLASGAYFLRLEAKDQVKTQRLTVVR